MADIRRIALAVFVTWLLPGVCAAQNFLETAPEFQRTNPKFISSFRPVVATASKSTVRVLCDGEATALGMIVGPEGWVLTKANDLKGKITCEFGDGKTMVAKLVGVHYEHDLAMLKVDAEGLTPVQWKESKGTQSGSWVALPGTGADPVAIGIVSVPTRIVEPRDTDFGFLGVVIQSDKTGLRITKVSPKTAAARAGLREGDIILALEGQKIDDSSDFVAEMQKRRPGQSVEMRILRDGIELSTHAVLGQRPRDQRSEYQNRLGSELSTRIGGYSSILQHDSVVRPNQCGGPIVDLDGKVIGVNICRAGRTESWAVPSELVKDLLFDLVSGKLAPKGIARPADPIDQLRSAVERAEQNLASARSALQNALNGQTANARPTRLPRDLGSNNGSSGGSPRPSLRPSP